MSRLIAQAVQMINDMNATLDNTNEILKRLQGLTTQENPVNQQLLDSIIQKEIDTEFQQLVAEINTNANKHSENYSLVPKATKTTINYEFCFGILKARRGVLKEAYEKH